MNRQWVIKKLPNGPLETDTFELKQGEIPEAQDRQVVIKTRLLSMDAGARQHMNGATWGPQLQAGSVMFGNGVGEVVASKAPSIAVGDIVGAWMGWQEYSVFDASAVEVRDRTIPLEALSALFGAPGVSSGLTAFHGLIDIGRPRPGETVVVSAAAGSVGSLAAQMGKILDCRVVGIAGGKEKCAWLINELGIDAAADYKAADFLDQLRAACPDGIHVFFDNTAGAPLETALQLMNVHGRIASCGGVANYNSKGGYKPIAGFPTLLTVKRVLMQGFLVMDIVDRPLVERTLVRWMKEGRLKVPTTKFSGFESAPQALMSLLSGECRGKVVVIL